MTEDAFQPAVETLTNPAFDFSRLESVHFATEVSAELFEAISAASGLKKLTVSVRGLTGNEALFKLFEKCQLHELTFICTGACQLSELSALGSEKRRKMLAKLRLSCGKVYKITVHCLCNQSALTEFLPAFTALRQVDIKLGYVTEQLENILRKLEKVSLQGDHQNPGRAIELAGKLAGSVHAVHDSFCTKADLEKLAPCTNLQELHVLLGQDAESALLPAVGALRELRLVKELHPGTSRSSIVLGVVTQSEIYGRLTPGVLLNLVRAAPHLQKLSLKNIEISKDELVDIMKHMGPRLTHLSTCIQGQTKNAIGRLEDILVAAVRYNPNLVEIACPDPMQISVMAVGMRMRMDSDEGFDFSASAPNIGRCVARLIARPSFRPRALFDVLISLGLLRESDVGSE